MSDSTDPQAEPAASPAEEKSLDQLLVEALARIEEQKDARLRAVAEVENVRKRAQADVAAAHKFAVERMAESLVPVMDSLEAALNAAQDAPQANAGVALKALRDGVELTLKQLQAALQKASITDIAPAVGGRVISLKSNATGYEFLWRNAQLPLAQLPPDSAEAAGLWAGYLVDWTFWNHVRAAAAIAASASFAVALRKMPNP